MDVFTCRLVGLGIHAGDFDGIALSRIFSARLSGQPGLSLQGLPSADGARGQVTDRPYIQLMEPGMPDRSHCRNRFTVIRSDNNMVRFVRILLPYELNS